MGSKQFWNSVARTLAVAAVAVILVDGAGAANKEKVLYSFTGGNDGGDPAAALAFDKAGNLYGTTVFGGTGAACTGAHAGCGTVFKLTRNSNGRWQQTVIYNFQGIPDGKNPYGGVTIDAKGNLYGTTVAGGSGGACPNGDGCGTVYRLTRSGNSWTETVLYSFTGGTDGAGPGGGVTFDKKGNLYGTTPDGGKPNGCFGQGCGVVYQLFTTKGGSWQEKVIHTFKGGRDGATGSLGTLHFDKAGNLYGVAETGGDVTCACGTAFKLSPASSGRWKFATLYIFKGTPDASFPSGGLISDAAGHLYGTTNWGGANGLGTAFQLTRGSNGQWSETLLYSFQGSADGGNPTSTLVFDSKGHLYGTTSAFGDNNGDGVVFKLTHGSGGWKESVAHSFSLPSDGANPNYGLVLDKAGDFYGTTVNGGPGGQGAVFELTP
jgi:uncharacterized repeat protein (TIGR03803 family)